MFHRHPSYIYLGDAEIETFFKHVLVTFVVCINELRCFAFRPKDSDDSEFVCTILWFAKTDHRDFYSFRISLGVNSFG